MLYTIAGLGNKGEEYKNTRHNTGRIMLEYFRRSNSFIDWEEDKKNKILMSSGKIGESKVVLLEPNNFMNNSGKNISYIITNIKKVEKLIVIYDDIDLPLGVIKIAYNRGSGGHRGIESVIKKLKTKSFIRLRVGVSNVTPTGKMKKPKGEQKVLDFLMGEFKPKEMNKLKLAAKKVTDILETIILEGKDKAMNMYN